MPGKVESRLAVLGALSLAGEADAGGGLFCLMDLCSICSRKTSGCTCALVEPMLTSMSASSLLSLPICRSSQPSKVPSIML